ncbi:ABC transporter ATP-binding protein [Halostreptopolyspora alba]|uniref:ABC transporter ATP-binding protein n=1 Tax=Halostreptopolyspora alba TaxID=2487137 RepID=A0A3N0EG29_9ACTN|nr:ABC transporter ATP-binding protein [Nocardiopsaceae bacterium YIM 96095]
MLEVADLRIRVPGSGAPRYAVEDVGFRLRRGERLGLIGESGSGKSMTALALMGLLPRGCTATGSVRLDGTELLTLDERSLRRIRGSRMAMVFQDVLTALNPLTRVGRHVAEPFRRHRGMGASAAARAAAELLERVGFPDPDTVARAYPAHLSGGQRQRVCLAMALACQPRVLIADEPTTALDATVQAEILDLLDRTLDTVTDQRPALLFVSHDLAVLARVCDHVLVLREGRVVERGPVQTLLRAPENEHTRALLADAREAAWNG